MSLKTDGLGQWDRRLSRRQLLCALFCSFAGTGVRVLPRLSAATDENGVAEQTLGFIRRCAREDGGYAASPDLSYPGYSDTGLSDLAGVTYAATLAKTMGWKLPQPKRSIEFVQQRQQSDGSFVHRLGKMDPKSDLAVLYNTVQGAVALRALGARPRIDPTPVLARFFVDGAFKKLPWYTTSFFPLLYAVQRKPFPEHYDNALRALQIGSQTEDGYLGDHVAATFHMAHYFRLVGQPTPKAQLMVARVLRDQRPDGGWNIKEPDWDVHAAFDAVYILRQLGGDTRAVQAAIQKAADWVMTCRNSDGGFGHYPNRHSDMDAVYFQFGTLIQAGRVRAPKRDLPDAHTLSWGHAMLPGKVYS